MIASRSRADLVRLLGAPDAGLLDKCAGLLGFQARPVLVRPRSPLEGMVAPTELADGVQEAPASTAGSEPKPALRLGFYRVTSVRFPRRSEAEIDRVPAVKPPWEDEAQGNTLDFPEAPPLVSWPRLWRRLRRHLGQQVLGRDVDIPALVSMVSRAETIVRLPRRRLTRFPAQPQLLVDRTRRQMPFWSDQDRVRASLSRWTSRHGGRPIFVLEGASPPSALSLAQARGWDFRGTLVLLLGDLGTYGDQRDRERWRQAGRWLCGQGAVLRAVVPAPFWRVERSLAILWNAMPWDANERRAPPASEVEREARVRKLLTVVAPALRLEPGLLRAARSLIPPRDTDSGTEADLLAHPAIVGRSSVALALDPEHKKSLEAEFENLDQPTRGRACALLDRWHRGVPPEIANEERFQLALRFPGLIAPAERERLFAFMCRALVAMDFVDSREKLPARVVGWFRDLEDRLPSQAWTDARLGEPLRRAWAVVHRDDVNPHLPPGFTLDDLQLLRRGKALTRTRWRLWQVGQSLRALPAEFPPNGGTPVPSPRLGQAVVGTPMAEIVAAEPRVMRERHGRPALVFELSSQEVRIELPESGDTLVLKTDCQELTLEAFDKPDWAKRAGRDRFGLWAEFEYQGVVQRMRWITPGRFWMGSPKDEPERLESEARHEVELTHGYWLADTACTQELWKAVMGKNPSAFTERKPGENSRPVERVSWDDCKQFIDKLNRMVPGLQVPGVEEARLATEAEWENACRAGRTTPFSFGSNITTDQVNYHGEYPYAGAPKGGFRGKTVPVKALPANPWGLYEMHGNVWEWCEDEYAPYRPGLAADPIGAAEGSDVRFRVVRGGSWDVYARFVRSADRIRLEPGVRGNALGFRLARGRQVQQDRPAGAEGARGTEGASGASPTEVTRATEAADERKKTPTKKRLVDRMFGKKGKK